MCDTTHRSYECHTHEGDVSHICMHQSVYGMTCRMSHETTCMNESCRIC